ncbi:hypothetical protein J6590_096591 [Homalodisca vitripennis]|nr:hypothetical protein J6590_096591 [Homalodisca vitripennis]
MVAMFTAEVNSQRYVHNWSHDGRDRRYDVIQLDFHPYEAENGPVPLYGVVPLSRLEPLSFTISGFTHNRLILSA